MEIIGGRELTQTSFASLYIVKTSLRFLELTSLTKILAGSVAILENKHLCYVDGINWTRFKRAAEMPTYIQNNRKFDECRKYTCEAVI